METKDQKFQALFTKTEKKALRKLARKKDISMNSVLRKSLRTMAKREKCLE
jgi:hypothetical protein